MNLKSQFKGVNVIESDFEKGKLLYQYKPFKFQLILGLFFALIGMGLTLTAALILITGYDGIFVWIAGPLIMVGPFYIFLLIKYPDKLKELDDKLGFKKKKR